MRCNRRTLIRRNFERFRQLNQVVSHYRELKSRFEQFADCHHHSVHNDLLFAR
jgi:hypothetical protein